MAFTHSWGVNADQMGNTREGILAATALPSGPSQSVILIVGSKANFVCSLNALQFSQWPLHILSQIPILINCLQIIKLLRDNGMRLMYTTKARSPVTTIGLWSNLLWYPKVIRSMGVVGMCSPSSLPQNLLTFLKLVSLPLTAKVFRRMARGDLGSWLQWFGMNFPFSS